MKIDWNGVDITASVVRITWSGSASEAARKVEFEVASGKHDAYIKRLDIKLGDQIIVSDDSGELFQGMVYFREKSGKDGTLQYTSYDAALRMLKNKATYNFKNQTAEGITSAVCADIQIPVGKIASTGVNQKMIVEGESIYDIVVNAYASAAKQNGKKYSFFMASGKFNVVEKGSVVAAHILSDQENIIDSSYSETLEQMINRIAIYDDKGNKIGQKDNPDWISKYGVMQDVYKQEKDKNPGVVAEGLLTGIEETASIEAIGNLSCTTGNAVKIEDKATGLIGLFWIEADQHTFESGQHTMSLELGLKEVK